MNVRDIDLVFFCNFLIGFWNCVVFRKKNWHLENLSALKYPFLRFLLRIKDFKLQSNLLTKYASCNLNGVIVTK
jgi:hypothetical protein